MALGAPFPSLPAPDLNSPHPATGWLWTVSGARDMLLAPQQVDLAQGEGLEGLCSSKQKEQLCGTTKPASHFLCLSHTTKTLVSNREKNQAGLEHTGHGLHFVARHSVGRGRQGCSHPHQPKGTEHTDEGQAAPWRAAGNWPLENTLPAQLRPGVS